ncbi:programmed cell death 1 ligand 1 [Thalassophryne amazonica]|uniref:programmed cell death 1 ligand 1 n=1 Tax=Thalassophryne amazonica TaxID=390379 RepID=UPI001470DAD9|nr:programmed cell death 1 ligand 1 [Thalassophryne amazonica]XP_034044066.1 programmed cell death 1 ligand 1 [Thalassophryne amazonica]XP_034044067.1 programmed cell death 1 ligand 1 [Thalassophryne amazonica]
MAYVGIQSFLIALWAVMADASSLPKVDCKTDVVAQYSRQTTLECTIKDTQSDIEIRVVTWTKAGEALLSFHNGKVTSATGVQFAEPSWNSANRNVSLLITNTGMVHAGIYECEVVTMRGRDKREINLSVTAKYSKPTIRSVPKTIDPNAEATLICSSSGGYPEGQLHWFDVDNYEWTKNIKTDVTQTDVGLYNLTSKLQLGSVLSKYTCVVFNASGSKEDEATFNVPPVSSGQGGDKDSNSNKSTVVAPMVVIGSLIVGLLLLIIVLYKTRKRAGAKRHSVVPLIGEPEASPANDYTRTDEDEQLQDV